MKAASLTHRPTFQLMKQSDIQNFYHLQMPRWLFADSAYKPLSLEAKVGYTFLLNRFQLSRRKGWLNDVGEVFIIFTRQSLADEMQISYRKAIEAMKELTAAGLIWEKRCGRGDANQIYLAKLDHDGSQGGSVPFEDEENEHVRSAEMALLEVAETIEAEDIGQTRHAQSAGLTQDVSILHPQTCETGTSAPADIAGPEVPILHPSYIDKSHIEGSDIDVSLPSDEEALEQILERCELQAFPSEREQVYQAAIERLFYLDRYRIGGSVLPRSRVRNQLNQLTFTTISAADQKLASNTTQEIKNSMGYIMAVLFNSITEAEGDLMVDPYLNQIGGDTG
jgi:Replication initiator protein A (RepA) N-terminus.